MARPAREKPYTIFRIRDTDGTILEEWDDRDACGDWPPPCGGCGRCMALQWEHGGGELESERVEPPPPPVPRTPWSFPVVWD